MRRLPLRLGEMTYVEARHAAEDGAVAFLPAGATEAHGPHLPLWTDVIIAEHAAVRAARLLRSEGREAVALPPIAYGVTNLAAGFGGTISLPAETVRVLARDVILGAAQAGFAGVVVCNAHLEPGHLTALRDAVREANEGGARSVFPDITQEPHALLLGEEFESGACHAGSFETSLVLAADPFLVHEAMMEGLEPNPTSLTAAIREGKTSFVDAGGPLAYFGDPAKASASEGEERFRALAQIFADAARELLRGR